MVGFFQYSIFSTKIPYNLKSIKVVAISSKRNVKKNSHNSCYVGDTRSSSVGEKRQAINTVQLQEIKKKDYIYSACSEYARGLTSTFCCCCNFFFSSAWTFLRCSNLAYNWNKAETISIYWKLNAKSQLTSLSSQYKNTKLWSIGNKN